MHPAFFDTPMIKIGLLSDTHAYMHPRILEFFRDCDEIWHAGDIGDLATAEELAAFKPFRAVYGNIDGADLRDLYPREMVFTREEMKVLMIHIGGYPGHYPADVRNLLLKEKPDLFICGHSHILKVIYDPQYRFLLVNPGACGKFGFHKSITSVRFVLEKKNIRDLEVLDIPRAG